MGEVFWLTDAQVERLRPLFPKSRARVDDRRVLNGIIYVNCSGVMWTGAPATYVPPTTLYNRWNRWGRRRSSPA